MATQMLSLSQPYGNRSAVLCALARQKAIRDESDALPRTWLSSPSFWTSGSIMDKQAVVNTYANLMTPIKSRLNILRDLIADHRRYPDLIVMEFTQLQIRMICETLTIGCLVAHGDLKATRSGKLTKTYQADYIINEL
jgi:hypothetical protein